MKIQAEINYDTNDTPLEYHFQLKHDCQDDFDPILHETLYKEFREASELFFLDIKVDSDNGAFQLLKDNVFTHLKNKKIQRLELNNAPPIQTLSEIEEFYPKFLAEFREIMQTTTIRDIFIHIESWVEIPRWIVDELVDIHDEYYKNNVNTLDTDSRNLGACNLGVFAKYRFDEPSDFFRGRWDDNLVSDQEILSKSIEDLENNTNRLDYDNLIPRHPKDNINNSEDGSEAVTFE